MDAIISGKIDCYLKALLESDSLDSNNVFYSKTVNIYLTSNVSFWTLKQHITDYILRFIHAL